jgi:hypothetical protein
MTSATDIDSQVKGPLPSGTPSANSHPPLAPSNPLEIAPASPSQVYLNLLILEASLRSQYLNHLGRRRKFTFFLIVLFLWTALFCYRFVVLGGSPYYYVSHLEKLGLGGGAVTGVLYYATGLYHTTIVEPRRFVAIANRGLRGFNVKLVKVPLTYRQWICWWWGWYTSRIPSQHTASSARHRPSSNSRRSTPPIPSHTPAPSLSSIAVQGLPDLHEENDDEDEVEEYLSGGLHLKLVILPKGFSPDFREGWELYRTEYWEKENEARKARRRTLGVLGRPKLEEAVQAQPDKRVRSSRAGSVSSRGRRTPTPDPDMVSSGRPRKGSTASSKRRPVVGQPTSEISDSGSATSAVGVDMEMTRRSDAMKSPSFTAMTRDQTRKSSGKGRGRKRVPKENGSPGDDG